MACLERSYTGILSTLANYKLFGKAIQDIVTATGCWTQTADTGQVTDWTALGSIGASAAAANYMVFTNSNSTLHTVYVRVALWIAAGAAVNIRVEMGLTTDGAGTITGTVCGNAAFSITWTSQTAASYNRMIGSADADRFAFAWQDASNVGGMVVVDASRDNAGAVTDEYYWLNIVFQNATSNWSGMQFEDGTLGPVFSNCSLPHVLRFGSSTAGQPYTYNGTPVISPVCPMYGKVGNPTLNAIVVPLVGNDLDTHIDVNLYGTTRRYRAFYPRGYARYYTNTRTCILWE